MKFKIITEVSENQGQIDVTIKRIGRIRRQEGAIAAALQFGITEEVRRILGQLQKLGQKHGEAVSK